MGAVVEVVELDAVKGARAGVSGEVETMGREESTFFVEKGAGDRDMENGVHCANLFVVEGFMVNANCTGQPTRILYHNVVYFMLSLAAQSLITRVSP